MTVTSKLKPSVNVPTNHGSETDLFADAMSACREIAPLWPLKSFVAVNPMLEKTKHPFETVARELARTLDARLLLDRQAYAKVLDTGEIQLRHLAEAIRLTQPRDIRTPDEIMAALEVTKAAAHAPIDTIADLATSSTGANWSRFAVDQISFWASSYFDEGQSAWKNPWRDQTPFVAWRNHAQFDRTPEIMGLKGFCASIATLPDDPISALDFVIKELGIHVEARPLYFERLLSTVSGWAGYRRYQGWGDELQGGEPNGVIDILTIRAAFDYAIWESLKSKLPIAAWRASLEKHAPHTADLQPQLVAQTARELAYQERLITEMATNAKHASADRPEVQAVFCIDVRSERIRRALETVNSGIETFGFAGFFGVPIALCRDDGKEVHNQCPVLLEPTHMVRDIPHMPSGQYARPFAGAWKRFKTGAISSFAFVESWGAAFAGALLRDLMKKPKSETTKIGKIDSEVSGTCGIPQEDKIALAKGALAGMSLTNGFARLVALVGHGSTTTNNPYASGLDCGACGGHTGEANARVASAILNDPAVREALAADGIVVPDDTWFIAALHDTTTDEIRVFDEHLIPGSHAQDMACLKRDLIDGCRLAQRDRAKELGLNDETDLNRAVSAKSRDWAEVRPEWGLAGCAAFIAAPRECTRGLDLAGRTFLHSYEWKTDTDNAILEVIITAPLVVASWIGLQYYASSVDNQRFGSGDKTLHNVVGGLGVLEGCGGDLRVGLPLQSVHTGTELFHQPLRLTAVIAAPTERIDLILNKHPSVKALFANGWLHLIALNTEDGRFQRLGRDGAWSDISSTRTTLSEAAA